MLIFVIFISIGFSACSSDESNTSKQSSTSTDKDLTGERFFDSASSKVMANNPGFSQKLGNCVVKAMTADGQYGLGEINQMKLDNEHFSENASGINKAYLAALKSCK